MSIELQYDSFAADYHWLYSDYVLSGDRFLREQRGLVEKLPPRAAVLDCACGIGIDAVTLARLGHEVHGTDASPAMLAEAGRRADAAGVSVDFTQCRWRDLATHFGPQFDLVLYSGNAIGHCADEADMVAVLQNIRDVLKPGGRIAIDTRNWEKLRADRVRFSTFGLRQRNDLQCIPLLVWTIPGEWQAPHVIEVVLLFTSLGSISLKNYRIVYHAFRREQLFERLAAAGFTDIQTDYSDAGDSYTVYAKKPEE